MILTPEQIEQKDGWAWDGKCVDEKEWSINVTRLRDLADTLAAYAEIVQAVAEGNPERRDFSDLGFECRYCGKQATENWHSTGDDLTLRHEVIINHEPDCPHCRARKLRGLG